MLYNLTDYDEYYCYQTKYYKWFSCVYPNKQKIKHILEKHF